MKKLFYILLSAFASTAATAAAGSRIVVSSYPWQKLSIVEMTADLNKMGVDKVSMFQNIKIGGDGQNKDVVFSYKMSDAARAEAKAVFDKAGIKVVGIGHITLKDEAEIKKLFDFAKYFGVEVMTVEAPRDALKYYDKLSTEYGIKAGLYNHPVGKAPYSTPDKMLGAISGFKSLKCFPDCGHWGRSKIDIGQCIDMLKGNIIAVNVQDLSTSGNCIEYGKGVLPLDRFISNLAAQGFDGYVIVMFNVAPDRSQIDMVPASVEFLRKRGIK